MLRFSEVSLRSARWILGLVVLLGLLAGGPLRGALQHLRSDWSLAADPAEVAEVAEVEAEDEEALLLDRCPPAPSRAHGTSTTLPAPRAPALAGVLSSILRPPNA